MECLGLTLYYSTPQQINTSMILYIWGVMSTLTANYSFNVKDEKNAMKLPGEPVIAFHHKDAQLLFVNR